MTRTLLCVTLGGAAAAWLLVSACANGDTARPQTTASAEASGAPTAASSATLSEVVIEVVGMT